MCLVSAMLGFRTVLCCWTGSNADGSTDQHSFIEAHLAFVDGQVLHAAHVGLFGGNALWEDEIWEDKQIIRCEGRCIVGNWTKKYVLG